MIIWGINALNHDAAISVVDSDTGRILFAGHAERYSRIKNDEHLNQQLIDDAILQGALPDLVVWYENPWGRKLRQLKCGQYDLLKEEPFPKQYLKQFGISCPVKYSNHHAAHAAGGYFTSKFINDPEGAAILVIDGIGELTTASIWYAKNKKLKQLWSLKYPYSLGLFYSAITALVGLKPNEEEYILMGMAAYGHQYRAQKIVHHLRSNYFNGTNEIQQSFNFHRGIPCADNFLHEGVTHLGDQFKYDVALAAQILITEKIQVLVDKAFSMTKSKNLVYSGGVALNCVANSALDYLAENIWILPNPGDAGNSLGAIAEYLRKPIQWKGPFLGHTIIKKFNIDAIIEELETTGVCGIAHGSAEFGPRAFGNRSLLADPRRIDMKDKVNEIKQRQKFRPFAPAVLEEYAHHCFKFPKGIRKAPYMQFVARVLEPEKWPAIAHIDNTARVQTVGEESPILRQILERWYQKTKCPMLLNTSLNIKGEPLVNTWEDAVRWEQKYGVKVF